MTQVLVSRADIGTTAIDDADMPALEEGQVLLAVEQFAVTANNITYAAMGEAMRYWDFFPARDGWGIVPVWGHARVVHSRSEGIDAGERIYGYWPMASHAILTPGAVKPDSFVDTAPHRQHLAAVYNRYRRIAADAGHRGDREDVRAVFEPLFLTSWLIRAMFARENWHGADTLVMTSASSKTALALAHFTRRASPEIARIGLTSPGNVGLVQATGLYDRVLPYDAADALRGASAVAVDFAGNGAVLRRVHEALGAGLSYSCLVGLTHWDARGGAGSDLPGPKPMLFFAPDHVAATVAERGSGGFASAVAADWAAFAEDAASLVTIRPVAGLEAAADAYRALVKGEGRADEGIVVRV